MNVLESGLEALAFNYLSYGIFTVVNNLWTWVAVITAAVSFWRIRGAAGLAVTCSLKKPDRVPPCHVIRRYTSGYQRAPEALPAEDEDEPCSSSAPAAAAPTRSLSDCYDALTKGRKFTLCYEDEGESEADKTVKEWDECDGNDGGGDCREWWESWERLLRTKNGEMEWYRYQDLTVINGNVVRLWEEHGSHRSYGSSCAVW